MKGITILVSIVFLMFLGCGNQTASVKQETSTPTGSVQGVVVDYNTNSALAGVMVSTTSGGGIASTKSNAAGIYQLAGLPTGAYYPVYFSLFGYGTSIYGTNLGNTPPTFPQGNALAIVNAYMYKADGSIKGTVYDANGNPFTQTANVMIDMRNLTGNTTGFIGINEVFRTNTSPADGSYSFQNIPAAYDCSLSAPIVAWYVDPDGVYYAGQSTVDLCSGATSFAPDLFLTCNLPVPNVSATSQDVSANNSSSSTPLTVHIGVFYNQPMDHSQANQPAIFPLCNATQTGFVWTSTTAGQFTVTVNPNINCSGRQFIVHGGKNVCGVNQNNYTGTFN
jgi:hypothetical protein